MVKDVSQDTGGNDSDAGVNTVADKAFAFGRAAAQPVGEEPFRDPVMHHYFLLFMYGAVAGLADHEKVGAPLDEIDQKRAMATMLAKFGTATPEEIVSLVKLLDEAYDEPARRIKGEGEQSARAWDWGVNEEAAGRFEALMKDPTNFPGQVEQVLKSDVAAPPGQEPPDAD